jgi:SAM-dependent methyltransferase
MLRQLFETLRHLALRRLLFTWMYLRGTTPWDTGITPPELVLAAEGAGAMPPGRALDLGCGTGTNCLYLARHGWQAIGIDFATPAILRAEEKAKAAGPLPGSARFIHGDVTHLERLPIGANCSLILDLGCLHGIEPERRVDYAAGITHFAAPSALLLIYSFEPQGRSRRRPIGASQDEIEQLFADGFRLEKVERGTGRNGAASAWYWLRRIERV